MPDEKPPRPIDSQRNAGFAIRLNAPGDSSEVEAMIGIDSRLHVVTARGVYVFALADQIDPERSNPAIPNSQQQVLNVGADSPIVGRVLLTADRLFKKTFLGDKFDDARALSLAWALTRNLLAMQDLLTELGERQNLAIVQVRSESQGVDSLRLPAVGSPELAFHAFAQKLGHAVDALENVALLFYPELGEKWVDALGTLVLQRYGEVHPFSTFLRKARPELLAMRGLRNAIEHPKADYGAVCYDFRLLSSGKIRPPSVELKMPNQALREEVLCSLMVEYGDKCLGIAEAMFAHMCNVNVRGLGGMGVAVQAFPFERAGSRYARMSYAAVINGELVSFG
jgi:hypothetical protein